MYRNGDHTYMPQDINNIEGIQRRLTKMVREVEEEEYEQRMKKTTLMSLEMIRLRSDLIEVYNIMHNLEGIKREDFFPLHSAGRRGHQYTITKQYSRLNSRKHFFSQRVVDQWNRLPSTTVWDETTKVRLYMYGIRLVRNICDATPAVMLSPPGYIRTIPIVEKFPANAMRLANNPPCMHWPPAGGRNSRAQYNGKDGVGIVF